MLRKTGIVNIHLQAWEVTGSIYKQDRFAASEIVVNGDANKVYIISSVSNSV
jgi:hypothetical protein